jgi:hypothetical protein
MYLPDEATCEAHSIVPTVAGSLYDSYYCPLLLLITVARNEATPAVDMIHTHGDC